MIFSNPAGFEQPVMIASLLLKQTTDEKNLIINRTIIYSSH